MRKNLNLRANIALGLIFAFLANTFGPVPLAQAQEFCLPAPGQMVALSPAFSPAVLKGIKLDPKNPFRFHFFVDRGDVETPLMASLRNESAKLIKYFFASLTIPEKDLWVNLSPYEKDRIVPKEFGQTEMGRDLLAEDYLLKQITASLIYPESQLGKAFWQKVYAQAQVKYGTTNIPINTFNKVWIVPEKAVVYENKGVAFVLENHLKVMLEQDYLSLEKHEGIQSYRRDAINGVSTNQLGSQIVREIVIPALTREVNEGKNFAQLRQVFYSLILATWYKKKIKDSILNKVYSNKNKIGGVNVSAGDKDKIYQEYLKAFKKGVYNYIKEESDPITNEVMPRKYFSGGVNAQLIDVNLAMVGPKQVNPAQIAGLQLGSKRYVDISGDFAMNTKPADGAMVTRVKAGDELTSFRHCFISYPFTIVKDILTFLEKNTEDVSQIQLFLFNREKHFLSMAEIIKEDRDRKGEFVYSAQSGVRIIFKDNTWVHLAFRDKDLFIEDSTEDQKISKELLPKVIHKYGLTVVTHKPIRKKSVVKNIGRSAQLAKPADGAMTTGVSPYADHTRRYYSVGDVIGAVNRIFYVFHPKNVMGFMTEENHTTNNGRATAIEFYGYLKELKAQGRLPHKIIAQEWGIGRGSFLTDFLMEFLHIDRTHEFLNDFEYQCYDISQNILDGVRTRVVEGSLDDRITNQYRELRVFKDKVTFHQMDLSRQMPHSATPPVFIRFNEMYDDFSGIEFVEKAKDGWKLVKLRPYLPADIHIETVDGKKVTADDFLTHYLFTDDLAKLRTIKEAHRILLDLEYAEELTPFELPDGEYYHATKEYLNSLNAEAGTRMPLNIGALKNLMNIPGLFSAKHGGVVQFFDYGIYQNLPFKEGHMSTFEKGYGGHLTAGVNFGYMEYMMKKFFPGSNIVIENQVTWQKRVFKGLVYIPELELDYGKFYHFRMVVNNEQMSKNDAMSANGGIDLNSAQMSMQVKKEGEDFKFDFNGTEIDAAQVTGATFTIRTMTPVTDLPSILGLGREMMSASP